MNEHIGETQDGLQRRGNRRAPDHNQAVQAGNQKLEDGDPRARVKGLRKLDIRGRQREPGLAETSRRPGKGARGSQKHVSAKYALRQRKLPKITEVPRKEEVADNPAVRHDQLKRRYQVLRNQYSDTVNKQFNRVSCQSSE